MALGDINGDGRLDIVVGNVGSRSVGVLLGQASGGFVPVAVYPINVPTYLGPKSIALGDLNGDGHLDIVTSGSSVDNSINVLLAQASGGFVSSGTVYSLGRGGSANSPFTVALGDINRDGHLDIVVANNDGGIVSVLLAQASGGFAAPVQYTLSASASPTSIALGDMNSDGYLDIVLGTSGSGITILYGQANAGFAAPISDLRILRSGQITLGDVNGDGRLDIVTSDSNVFLGQTGGGFAAPIFFSAYAGGAVALGDINADGRLDIITSSSFNSTTVGVLLNTTALANQPATVQSQPLVTISPNPTQGATQVQLSITNLPAAASQLDATLVNTLGQVVGQVSFKPSQGAANATLPTSGLAGGVYLVQVRARNAQGQPVGSITTQRLALY